MTRRFVRVDVATMWTRPDAPRPRDELAVQDEPDIEAWARSLDAEGRMDLHDRTLTQLLRDEPVDVLADADGWAEVAAPWQPAPEHHDGYHGWVRAAHLGDDRLRGGTSPHPEPTIAADRLAVVDEARTFVGLQYVWGGLSPWGLDCSGLVHLAYRRAGVVVPRDAYAQHAAATAVPLGAEQPGDLYFFARDDGHVFHVGFVTEPGRMLHAPETGGGGLIEEAPLPPERRARLAAAGRFLDGSSPAGG